MLLCAKYVIPVSRPHIENGAVLVRDDKIVEVGHALDMRLRYPDEEVRDYGVAALMPGFVDVHTHLEYAVMRGLAPDAPFVEWKRALTENEAYLTSEDWESSALLGGLEAVASGITTIADVTETGASGRAAAAIGIRAVVYREVGTMDQKQIKGVIHAADEDIIQWREATNPALVTVGMAANTLYTSHPALLSAVADYGSDGTPLALHIASSKEESDFVRYGSSPFSVHNNEMERGYGIDMPPWLPTGVTPVRYALNWGIFDAPNVIAINCVHVDETDIAKLAARDVAIAYCPRSNAKLGMGVAPVPEFLRAGIRVGLGTDSPASSDTMDPIDEMRIGLYMQRAQGSRTTFMDTEALIDMATLGGARALHMEDSIGSLDVGKQADIIVIDMSNSHQSPTQCPEAAIVHTSNQDNIIMTMVAGSVLYEFGKHRHRISAPRIKAFAQDMRTKLHETHVSASEFRQRVRSGGTPEGR